MTDSISNNRPPGPSSLQRAVAEKAERKGAVSLTQSKEDVPAEPAKAERAGGRDELVLSNVAQLAKDQPAYDKAKVESIKQAIKDGQYPLDARRIAENFHALEKMIRG